MSDVSGGVLLDQRLRGVGRSLAWGAKWESLRIGWQFLLKIVRGLVIPKILAPGDYGLFASLGVVLSYTQYADLGVQYRLAKRLPQALANGGEEAYRKMAGQGGAWILSTSASIAICAFLFSFLQHGKSMAFYASAFRLVACVIVAAAVRQFLSVCLSAREEFRDATLGSIVLESTSLLAAIVLLFWIGILGLVWAVFLAEIAGCVYYLCRLGVFPLEFRWSQIWPMVREGGLLLTISIVDTVLLTIDQMFILGFYPKEQYGLYSFALFVAGAALSFSGVFLTILLPRVQRLEAEGSREEAHRIGSASLHIYCLLTVAFLGILIPSVCSVIRFYLPKYDAAIPICVLLAGYSLVRGPAIILRPIYLSKNRESRLLSFQVLGVGLALGLDSLVIWSGGGLAAMAVSSLTAYAVVSGLMCWEFEYRFGFAAAFGKYVIVPIGGLGIAAVYLVFRFRGPSLNPARFLTEATAIFVTWAVAVTVFAYVTRRDLFRVVALFFEHPADPSPVL